MGLLDGLEKLITEHGSAAILKERIQLLNDRHTQVERALQDATAERDALKAQLQACQAQVHKVRRLQKDADRQREQQLADALPLPDERAAVLRFICLNADCAIAAIAQNLGLQPQVVSWHLDKLRERVMVVVAHDDTSWAPPGGYWNITAEGRDYLAERGLLDD